LESNIRTQPLIDGYETSELTDVRELLKLKEDLKAGCQGMKELLKIAPSLGGEEVFDI
jgi:hypothetical protein